MVNFLVMDHQEIVVQNNTVFPLSNVIVYLYLLAYLKISKVGSAPSLITSSKEMINENTVKMVWTII